MDIQDLRSFLSWMITPQDEAEMEAFKQQGLADDYIAIHKRIPQMTFGELVSEINNQLAPYGVGVDLLA